MLFFLNQKPKHFSFFVAFPIIENELVIGRYIGLADESIALYIDFSVYTNKITVYDVNDSSQFQDFQMIYNSETGNYEVVNTNRGFWCSVNCTVVALVIAASDGPSPLMDILAIAYQVSCLAQCEHK